MNSPSPDLPSHRPSDLLRGLLLGLTVCFCAASLYLCHRAIRVMERAVTVMEKVDAKLDRAIAAAPAAVGRGKELLTAAEAERLREGAKVKAAAIGEKAKDWIGGRTQEQKAEE